MCLGAVTLTLKGAQYFPVYIAIVTFLVFYYFFFFQCERTKHVSSQPFSVSCTVLRPKASTVFTGGTSFPHHHQQMQQKRLAPTSNPRSVRGRSRPLDHLFNFLFAYRHFFFQWVLRKVITCFGLYYKSRLDRMSTDGADTIAIVII